MIEIWENLSHSNGRSEVYFFTWSLTLPHQAKNILVAFLFQKKEIQSKPLPISAARTEYTVLYFIN